MTTSEAPPPEAVPATTAAGVPRTPSTPGRKPGQRNGTGATAARKAVPGPRTPPPPKKVTKDHRPTVLKTIKKLTGSLLVTAKTRNSPALAADAVALLDKKDEWAEVLNALAQDAAWLEKFLERAATIAPGVELGALALGLVAQVAVNHAMIPVEYGKLLDAEDPVELLARHGIKVQRTDPAAADDTVVEGQVV